MPMRTTGITVTQTQTAPVPTTFDLDAWTPPAARRALPLPVRIGLALVVAALLLLALLQAGNRLQAGAVHDPIRVEQVQAALIANGWAVAPTAGEVQHPLLDLVGTRLDLPENGSAIDIYLFTSTAERVQAEQQVVQWNRTLQRLGGDDGVTAVRISSVANALFIIVGDDLDTVAALHAVVAGLARA